MPLHIHIHLFAEKDTETYLTGGTYKCTCTNVYIATALLADPAGGSGGAEPPQATNSHFFDRSKPDRQARQAAHPLLGLRNASKKSAGFEVRVPPCSLPAAGEPAAISLSFCLVFHDGGVWGGGAPPGNKQPFC